ncbi:hypothetical protein EF847_16050 [Actinobacteria bacterium YIM 96077]|uniref:Uncharacterized protein n=1 Tax=Phytoactinopolyspora halophila TaxID=1981511 RepID=A0A329QCA7_9ACTN|nr:hypothetical protein [Phytoactinopolyspora halophila]AYY13988.1 hypothetical protein EF847_16050 [Actinobacteria bacterium YIM 96077]RAW10035.1 hypothetical protein DPM12_19765 [Phytoactinopolyspora halophila]
MTVYSVVDLTGIQDFVYGSNRLKDVVAASTLVATVLDDDDRIHRADAMVQALGRSGGAYISSAGGNGIVSHDTLADAQLWASHLSRALYEQAPGLGAVIGHSDDTDDFVSALSQAFDRADAHKRHGIGHSPLPRYPGVAICGQTGEAAVARQGKNAQDVSFLHGSSNENDEPIGRTIQRLDDHNLRPGASHETAVSGLQGEEPEIIDDLGRTIGEQSDIAIVHIDGNGIGARIRKWLDEPPDRDHVVDDYQFAALQLAELSQTMRDAVINCVGSAVGPLEDHGDVIGLRATPEAADFPLRPDRRERPDTVFLPVRILLCAGDDLTFVCDARVAHALTLAALRAAEQHQEDSGNRPFGDDEPVRVAAGISIHRAHHPIRLLTDDAEHRTRRAKETGVMVSWSLWGDGGEGENGERLFGQCQLASILDEVVRIQRMGRRGPWRRYREQRRDDVEAYLAHVNRISRDPEEHIGSEDRNIGIPANEIADLAVMPACARGDV